MAERRLTILQLLPALETGGVERGTLEVARGLVEAGHRSLVVSGGGRLVSRLTGQGSEHIELPVGRKSPAGLWLVPKLRRLMREQQVDILHLRSRFPAWLGWLAWRGLTPAQRPGLVTTVHGFYSPGRYSRIMTRGQRVIAVSDSVRRYVEATWPKLPTQRIRVIPRGIDPAIYPFGYRPPDGWLDRWYAEFPFLLERRLLTLPGRITRLKGHADFLRLVADLARADPSVYGLVVGAEDPRHRRYAEQLHRLARRLGVQDRVGFIGHRLDLRDILAVSSLVCSLSARPESFGRTVCEALSLGVPVLGYDHGGVGETLARVWPEGRVPPGDQDALAATARRLLAHGARPEPARFTTLEEMCEQTLAVYRELDTGAPPGGTG
ncbi:MAG TPA: glycosyltransferase [Thiotrichales bacterium]|nr:glycosyltransferase [Thiotrichales bacterium]